MHILVIGGTGFLGSNISRMLIEEHNTVDILCRGRTDMPILGVNRVYHLNRHHLVELHQTFAGATYDVIVDVCAYSGDDVKYALASIHSYRYILCSTCEMYNFSGGYTVHSTDHPVVEYAFARKYIRGKLDAECEVIKSEKSYCIIRPSYIYGSGNTLRREDTVFSALFAEAPILLENTETTMNLIHVVDLSRIFTNQVYSNRNIIINASNPERISYRHYLNACEHLSGCKAIVVSNSAELNSDKVVLFPYLNRSIMIDPFPYDENCVEKMISFSDGMRECFHAFQGNDKETNRKLTVT